MLFTCQKSEAKTKTMMIQLRNVLEALHRSLKARAATAGMSLSNYLLTEIKQIAEQPTLAELRDRLRAQSRCPSTQHGVPGAGTTRRAVIVLEASAAIDWLLQT